MNRAALTPDVLRRAFEVFDRVRVEPAGDREHMLDSDQSLNDEVRSAVRELLAHDSPTGEFLGVSVGAASARLLEPLAEALTPTSIGRYRVLRELGRGGFGRVYLAEQDRPRRAVAVKVLRAGSSMLEARRLLFEAEALARLDHPAIARVYESGTASTEDPRPFLAMEYIEGEAMDLYARGLCFADRCELLVRVCEGLDHAHRRGVLHRDLAPKNILVDSTGRPRIIDFGLASMVSSSRNTHSMTIAGTVLGTLCFMSPEQLSGDRLAIDTRSDIFSLGVIVFQILTGRHPFLEGSPPIGVAIRSMLESPAVHPSSIDPTLSGDADAVLLRCVEREPSRRYQSALELAHDLDNLRCGRQVAARSYSRPQLVAAFVSRHRTGVAAAAAVSIALLVGATVAGFSLRRAANANDAAANALDAVVTHVIAPLAPRVGTTEDRARLLDSIGPDIHRMLDRAHDDPRVARITAAYFAARADLCVDHLNYLDALPLYQRATGLYAAAFDGGDTSIDTAHAASIVLVKLGDCAARLGGNSHAIHSRALAFDERLAERHPGDLRVLNNLFWSHWRLAESTFERPLGDHADRAARVADAMNALDPHHWRTLEARMLVLTRRGLDATLLRRFDDARSALCAASQAAHGVLDAQPGTAAFLKPFVEACVAAASIELDFDRIEDAAALLSKAQSAIERLSVATLDQENQIRFLHAVHEPLARLELWRGDWASARRHADVVIDGHRGQRGLDRAGPLVATIKLRAMRTKAEALDGAGDPAAAAAWEALRADALLAARNPVASAAAIRWCEQMSRSSSRNAQP